MSDQEQKRITIKAAFTYFQSGQWDRALEEYKKLIDIDPMDFPVHNMIAEIHIRKGEKTEAINAYLKAASLQHATRNIEKAIRTYHNILKLDPTHAEAKNKMEETIQERLTEIDSLCQRGENHAAYEMGEQLYDKCPDHPKVQAKMQELEDWLKTSGGMTTTAKTEPDGSTPATGQPRAGFAPHRVREPIKKEEVVKNLYAMAEYYEQKQSWDEAVEAYITILRFHPEDDHPRNKLHELYRKITQQDKAEEIWSRISSESQRQLKSAKPTGLDQPRPDQAPPAEISPPEPKATASGEKPTAEHPTFARPTSGLAETVSEMEKLRLQAEEKLRRSIEERRERDKRRQISPTEAPTTSPAEPVAKVDSGGEETITILLNQVQMYIQQNFLVEAMRMCQKILDVDPANKDVRGLLKQIYDKKQL